MSRNAWILLQISAIAGGIWFGLWVYRAVSG